MDEVYVPINGEMRYLWRAVRHLTASREVGTLLLDLYDLEGR